jgi:hypothetical protein
VKICGSISLPISWFLAVLVKNSILAFAAFGVYDILILQDWFFPRAETLEGKQPQNAGRRIDQEDILQLEYIPVLVERTPLLAHLVAGALAGFVQSLIMDTWEVATYRWTHRRKSSFSDYWRMGVNKNFIARRIVHHSVGYATLFGTYESIRRSILQGTVGYLSSESPSVVDTMLRLEQFGLTYRNERAVCDRTMLHVVASFVAGGFAGQAHFIVGHYSSH